MGVVDEIAPPPVGADPVAGRALPVAALPVGNTVAGELDATIRLIDIQPVVPDGSLITLRSRIVPPEMRWYLPEMHWR